MTEKLKKKLLCKSGMAYPLVAVLTLVFLLFALGLFEIIRINIIVSNVRDKFQSAIIAECVANYSNIFDATREGYAASYKLDGFTWKQSNITTKNRIKNAITSDFSSGEENQVTIVDIDFAVEPSNVAPGDKENAVKFNITGKLIVDIPYGFAWKNLPPIRLTIDVKSEWRMMF